MAKAAQTTVDDSAACYNLANRTMFCNGVRVCVSDWNRGGSPISILLLKVNGCDKPAAGAGVVPSQVLQEVAAHIRNIAKSADRAGYYAHACFSLLIEASDPLALGESTERIKEQLLRYLTSQGSNLDLSFGAATLADGDDAVSLLKRAEQDLLSKDQPAETCPS